MFKREKNLEMVWMAMLNNNLYVKRLIESQVVSFMGFCLEIFDSTRFLMIVTDYKMCDLPITEHLVFKYDHIKYLTKQHNL